RGRAGRLAHEPVTPGLRLEAAPERIICELPHQESDRNDAAEEDEAENDRADDSVQQKAELGPPAVKGSEDLRRGVGHDGKHNREAEPIGPASAMAKIVTRQCQ